MRVVCQADCEQKRGAGDLAPRLEAQRIARRTLESWPTRDTCNPAQAATMHCQACITRDVCQILAESSMQAVRNHDADKSSVQVGERGGRAALVRL